MALGPRSCLSLSTEGLSTASAGTAFLDMKGFFRANLIYMCAFAEAPPEEQIVQQTVGQLPWGHNLVLLSKLKDHVE